MSLRGVKCLDVTHQIAGPWTTELLADLGAEVVKIENPDRGDSSRTYPFFDSAVFVTENRGKKSVTLNLKESRGREIALKLVAKSDIFVENFTPGLMDRLGLGYADLRKINPRLVYCSISGFGRDSRNANRPAWDAALQAMSGLMTITGEPERPPMRVGTSIVDLTAGSYALSGILLALLERERTGEGKFIDISLFDSAVSLVNYWIAYTSISGRVPTRMGNEWPALAPYQVFAAKDDRYLFIGASNNDFWKRLCTVLDLAGLYNDDRFSTNEKRVQNMKQLAALIEKTTKTWERDELFRKLVESGIPCSPVNTIDQLLHDPSLLERGAIVETSYPDSGKRFLTGASPLRYFDAPTTGQKRSPLSPPPRLGQHTQELLRELGYKDPEIEKLREDGVV